MPAVLLRRYPPPGAAGKTPPSWFLRGSLSSANREIGPRAPAIHSSNPLRRLPTSFSWSENRLVERPICSGERRGVSWTAPPAAPLRIEPAAGRSNAFT